MTNPSPAELVERAPETAGDDIADLRRLTWTRHTYGTLETIEVSVEDFDELHRASTAASYNFGIFTFALGSLLGVVVSWFDVDWSDAVEVGAMVGLTVSLALGTLVTLALWLKSRSSANDRYSRAKEKTKRVDQVFAMHGR